MDPQIIAYVILVVGFIFANLTVHASRYAKKNDFQHPSDLSLYIHFASTLSMCALVAWGMLVLAWWSPFVVFPILFQLFRFVVTPSNWQRFFKAIPITGALTTAITCGAWIYWAFALRV